MTAATYPRFAHKPRPGLGMSPANVAAMIVVLVAAGANLAAFLLRGASPPDFLMAGSAVLALILCSPAVFRVRLGGGAPVLAMMGATILVYFLSLLANPPTHGEGLASGIRTIVFMTLAFGAFVVGYVARASSQRPTQTWALIGQMGMAFALVLIIVAVASKAGANSLQKNILGGIIMHMAMLWAVSRAARSLPMWPTAIPLAAILLAGGIATQQRLLEVVAIAAPVCLLLWRTRIVPLSFPLAATALGAFSVALMVNYRLISGFMAWNLEVTRLTGRQITSGRQLLWGPVLRGIQEAPWLGHGPAALSTAYTGSTLSTHNSFLHIALQAGVFGLTATGLLLAAVALCAMHAKRRIVGSALLIYLGVVLLHATFETCLYQNNFPISSVLWLTIGLLCAEAAADPVKAAGTPAHNPR